MIVGSRAHGAPYEAMTISIKECRVTEQEIANIVAKYLIGNWGTIASSIGALLIGASTLTWAIFNVIHNKEIKVFQQRINSHTDNFNQFSNIMEQRLAMAEKDAEQLKEKLSIKRGSNEARLKINSSSITPPINASTKPGVETKISDTNSALSLKPNFGKKSIYSPKSEDNENKEIGSFIDRVSNLSSLIKVINQLM